MRNRSPRRAALGLASLGMLAALTAGGCSGAGDTGDDAGEPAASTSSTPSSEPTVDPTLPTDPTADPAPPGADDVQYVALGDSYAAAPGVPTTDPAGGCFRSDHNYAHLLAESADFYLTDMTCSGATSQDVVERQVPALSAATDVVTIGIGGNDFGLFSTILESCISAGGTGEAGSPCSDALAAQLDGVAPGIADNIDTTLAAITAAAPNAEVFVVGYPALLPASGTCPDLVPFAAGDYPVLTTLIRGLSDVLETSADARGLPYVDVAAASAGHDVCSEDPWVNGKDFAPDGTIPFHPLAAEQAAIAALVEDMQ